MDVREMPLSKLLSNRDIYSIFHEEFAKDTWLDVTALIGSEGTLSRLAKDGIVPKATLDRIIARLEKVKIEGEA